MPKTRCQFLGFILDSINKTLELPDLKREQLLHSIKKLRKKKSCSIREFAQLVDRITAACPAVQYGWLYTKSLERLKYLALLRNNGDYKKRIKIPLFLSADLDWREENIKTSINPIKQHKFVLEIFSDASTTGWKQWRSYVWSLEWGGTYSAY